MILCYVQDAQTWFVDECGTENFDHLWYTPYFKSWYVMECDLDHECLCFVAALDPLDFTISTSNSPVAGSPLHITCLVTKAPGLLQPPTAIWMNSDREPVSNTDIVTMVLSSNDTTAMAVLLFPSLLVSQGSIYYCTGSVMSLGSSVSEDESFDFDVGCKF